MTLKIQEGKYYRTRDGRKVGPAKWDLRNSLDKYPWDIPFPAGSYFYTEDGYSCIDVHEEDVIAEWKDTEDMTHEDTPKRWKDMTDEEKGALLLAHHEGEAIEQYQGMFGWQEVSSFEEPLWRNKESYRVKPAPKEPKCETVPIFGADFGKGLTRKWNFNEAGHIGPDTHKITFDLIDGVPDCGSIKMEEL